MAEQGESGRDDPDTYCHTCGGYHTDADRSLCPERRWQDAYRQGYSDGFHAGLAHYAGSHLRVTRYNDHRAA